MLWSLFKSRAHKKIIVTIELACMKEREKNNNAKLLPDRTLTMKRWMRVLFCCPTRWTRLIACASAAGLSKGSTRTTCCASKRLSPLAPCWIKSNNTWIDFGVDPLHPFVPFCFPLNWLMATCAFLNSQIHKQNNISIMKLKLLSCLRCRWIILLNWCKNPTRFHKK